MAITKREMERAQKADVAEGPRATAARYRRASNKIEVEYDNGVSVAVPVELIQEFTLLPEFPKPSDLSKIEVWGDGRDIVFPKIDAAIYAPAFLKGVFGSKAWMAEIARSMGSIKSPAKAAASRENGKKGGRPRKNAVVATKKAPVAEEAPASKKAPRLAKSVVRRNLAHAV